MPTPRDQKKTKPPAATKSAPAMGMLRQPATGCGSTAFIYMTSAFYNFMIQAGA